MSTTPRDDAKAGPPAGYCPPEEALGRRVVCTRTRCPFWETGGAVVSADCLLDRASVDFDRRPGSAEFVLALRTRLERPASPDEERDARALLDVLVDDLLGAET